MIPSLSPNPIDDLRQLLHLSVHGQRAGRGDDRRRTGRRRRLVRRPAPPDLRVAHPERDGLPRRDRRRARRAADGAGLLRGLHGGRGGDRPFRRGHPPPPGGVGRDRHRADGRPGRRLPLPVAQPGGARRRRDAAVRHVPGDHPRPGPRLGARRAGGPGHAHRAGAAAAVRDRSTARSPAPGACPSRCSTPCSCSSWRSPSPPPASSPARCSCSHCSSPRRPRPSSSPCAPSPGSSSASSSRVLTIWLALAIAYFSIYPVGFYVTTIGFVLYLLARTARAVRTARARRG